MSAQAELLSAETIFQEASQLAAAGEYVAALNRVLKAIQRDAVRAQYWHLLACLQVQLLLYSEALQSAAMVVRLAPDWSDGHYMFGRALKATGRLDAAVAHYRRAIELEPRPQYFCSLGVACRELGRLDQAIASYQSALALDPANREARNNLANALRLAGREAEAAQYQDARSGFTEEVYRLIQQATDFHLKGEFKQALLRWTDALRIAPQSVIAHHGQAATLYALHFFSDAVRHEEQALALQPDFMPALDGACKIALFAGDMERIERYGRRICELQPSDAMRIRMPLALPVVQESAASIAATRAGFDRALDELLATPLKIEQPDETLGALSFYLAYHGESNRDLLGKLGKLVVQACPSLTWVAPHCRNYRPAAGRVRVGFVSELLKNHSIGKTSSGLIAGLDRHRFEGFVLNLPGSARADDPTRRFIREHSEHWITLEGNLARVRETIAELRLDVLFYQDIGMMPFSYYLAFSRLAPVQCLSYGHPDTTGIPNLDYFVSQDLYELPGAADHYSERLFLLGSLPTLAYYYRPETPPESLSREDLSLRESDHVYLCAQTLFKLHPEIDQLFAGILARDPHAQIVLIEGQYKGWSERLRARFHAAMGGLADRITFIPRMDGERYLALLRMADVALDTIHFNGMNSSLEALAMGTPVVTLPKSLQRGRHTQAMYRQMELTECIARDAADYVDIAVRIGTEPDYRHALSRQILDRSPALFENARVLTEFERFYESALAAARS